MMKKYLLKVALFFSPFALAIGIELFVLPIDFFTFRVWEAVAVKRNTLILRGPFYPKMELTKIEEGDLLHHTKFTYKRKAKWITDRYGFRKEDSGRSRYDIVVIGDSNIAGCGSSQEDMLSEVLEDRLGLSVYSLAPASIQSVLYDKRFLDHPPHIVVVSSVERLVHDLLPLPKKSRRRPDHPPSPGIAGLKERVWGITQQLENHPWIQTVAVLLDRFDKKIMLEYVRASLRRMFFPEVQGIPEGAVPSSHGVVIFFQGAAANKQVPKEKLERVVDILKTYDEVLKERGIRFIFLPIPEKENIYHEYLHTERPVFLEHLISELKKEGIEVVDTQKAFEEAFQKGVLLYYPNDTHWNGNGQKIAADLLEALIRKGPQGASSPVSKQGP